MGLQTTIDITCKMTAGNYFKIAETGDWRKALRGLKESSERTAGKLCEDFRNHWTCLQETYKRMAVNL